MTKTYMINTAEIVKALKISKLILADELLSKIEDEGWELERDFVESPTNCRELHKTYSIRNKGLASRTSLHALQLYASTSEFVDNLKVNIAKSCYINNIVGKEEHEYFIAYEPENKVLLGIMKTYSQLKVSNERWREIWAAP